MAMRMEKDIHTTLETLKSNPRRKVLKVIEQKRQLERIKNKLANNPQKYAETLRKVRDLDKRLNNQLQGMRTNQIHRLTKMASRNPDAFRQELEKYNKMELKLKQQDAAYNNRTEKSHKHNTKRHKARKTPKLSR